MLSRTVGFLLALVVAALLAPPALALRAHVRVEGRTTTIFGAAQPRLVVRGPGSALDALEAASVAGEFYYHVKQFSFGPYVDQIGRYPAAGLSGWKIKVNGVTPQVGADKVLLKEGDVVLWYWGTFTEKGGARTLELVRVRAGARARRAKRPHCYRVLAVDDAGRRRPAIGAVLRVDGRRVRTRAGRACIGAHRGLVRATRPGALRSNALR